MCSCKLLDVCKKRKRWADTLRYLGSSSLKWIYVMCWPTYQRSIMLLLECVLKKSRYTEITNETLLIFVQSICAALVLLLTFCCSWPTQKVGATGMAWNYSSCVFSADCTCWVLQGPLSTQWITSTGESDSRNHYMPLYSVSYFTYACLVLHAWYYCIYLNVRYCFSF